MTFEIYIARAKNYNFTQWINYVMVGLFLQKKAGNFEWKERDLMVLKKKK